MQGAGDARRLGDILVDLGAMNRRDLERLVRQQVQEVIFELMNWAEGYFSFEETSGPRTNAEASVRIPTESLPDGSGAPDRRVVPHRGEGTASGRRAAVRRRRQPARHVCTRRHSSGK